MFELEHRVRRPDGTLAWTLSRAVPLLDEDGEIIEWVGAATDVTERKQAEQRLAEATQRQADLLAQRTAALGDSRERFQALAEASAQIVWTTDADGVVSEDSPSWRVFTGPLTNGWGWAG